MILEIRAGTGGDEAKLFAAELLRMYLRYAERHRMPAEILHAEENGIGGIGEAIVEISLGAPTAGSSSRRASIASSASP